LGIDVPEGAEGKNYTSGLMLLLDISATKEWALREGKEWEPYWKDQDTKLVHFIGEYCFSLHYFPCDVKSRRKLYFARQCACK
jgi:methionyl-tRNA synthetase